MGKQYIPLFLDFNETTQDLTDEECGRLVRAIVEYAKGNDSESRLFGAEKIAFRFLKGVIDRSQEISEVRRQARQGKAQQNATNSNKQEQTKTTANEEEKEEEEKDKDKDKNMNGDPPRRFTPPTTAEVAQYCAERKNGIDPAYFVDYYTVRGWTLSNGKKVKDWRACVRTWEHNGFSAKAQPKTPAQDYKQRDYSGAQAEATRRMMAMLDE